MNITIFEGEPTVEQLSARIFGDTLTQHPELTQQLLKANPHLKNLASLPHGTPIVVPRSDASGPANDPEISGARQHLLASIDEFEQKRMQKLNERENTLQARLALAGSTDVAAVAKGTPAEARLTAIVAQTKETLKAIGTEREAVKQYLVNVRALVTGWPKPRRHAAGR